MKRKTLLAVAAIMALQSTLTMPRAALAQEANACPVDGCLVQITSVSAEGDELALTFEANFAPDMSKNHIHVWWGDRFTVRQVSNNAETEYDQKQGDWHPTDAYPEYVTTGAASVSQRAETTKLCVSAADRNHDILDPEAFMCVDTAALF